MGLQGRAFQANIFIVDMVFLGDTRSAEELAVFTNMAPERLCLGCGLRAEEKFTPIFPGERGSLFAASVKLLQFALRASSASATTKGLNEEEGALFQAILPLVTNPDCHFLAVLTVLVQSILEGRTDCPISGVFGAGKTRAAAAMIAGLLVIFFFLHCRTSARHGRSTTEISMRLKSNFPGRKKPTRNKTNQKQATPTHKPRHGPGKSAREICKLGETR